MTKFLLSTVAALAVILPMAASAVTVVHEDPGGNAFRTIRNTGSAPVGLLTVSSNQTISGFGVDVDINGNSDLKFLIFDSTTGAILYQSAATSFVDTGPGYKFSNPFTFTFNPGTTYGLTASSSAGGTYFVDFVANTVGSFTFLTGNQNLNGNYVSPALNGTGHACCDVGTALVLGGAVPEPAGWALMLTGFGLVGGAMRRRQMVRVAAR